MAAKSYILQMLQDLNSNLDEFVTFTLRKHSILALF
jgi:hypothetical protein